MKLSSIKVNDVEYCKCFSHDQIMDLLTGLLIGPGVMIHTSLRLEKGDVFYAAAEKSHDPIL